ncbi:AAA family ATPase [Desulfonema magnum]|uniref:AAA ATPase domain-containing protein n=1 Tax=Desulfonema magnum TaxID=45655 RepID=A0A975BUI6_9BACT|nr:AAA family ATPase [Desulfonema magnum]QTA91567.1 AAA ATPase domain-containing protein [Desulfonema magnum]
MSKNSVIIAGPNGSGKSTFAQEYLKVYNCEYLGADDIAVELAPDRLLEVRFQAGRIFFQRLSALIRQGKNLLIESTISGRGFQGIMRRLKKAGYSITILFLFLETSDVCIARVKGRIRKGGHDVPEADIVRRFTRSKNNFWNIFKNQADHWYLFYNTEYFQQVAFGEGDNYTVNEEELFDLFIQDIRG